MNFSFVPAEATVAELGEKAAEFDWLAAKELEPVAAALRERAKLYRVWIAQLRSGRWSSVL